MKEKVIIVAGGVGKRMGSEIPKQFLPIQDKVILMHTIESFYNYNPEIEIFITLPQQEIPNWKKLVQKYSFQIPHKIVIGGKTRFESVQNGLKQIEKDCIIAIHDGVRPLVSRETIQQTFSMAKDTGSAIPVIPLEESLRNITEKENRAVPRKDYRLVQTPQVFQSNLIKKAYEQEYDPDFTDDASVLEKAGGVIAIVEGNPENIKITTKKDLEIAEVLMKYLKSKT